MWNALTKIIQAFDIDAEPTMIERGDLDSNNDTIDYLKELVRSIFSERVGDQAEGAIHEMCGAFVRDPDAFDKSVVETVTDCLDRRGRQGLNIVRSDE
jgi:hypothetical protein